MPNISIKKILIFALAFFLFVFPSNVSASLRVNPDNPYFLFNDSRFIVSWANNNHGALMSEMAAHKINHYEISVLWIDGRGEPLLGDRFPSDGNINFDEGYFSNLRNGIIAAGNKSIAVTIVLYGGPHFEADRTPGSRWTNNPWNSRLGGPIENDYSGLKEFISFEDYNYTNPLTSQYSSYDNNWPEWMRVKYRTEEIINKFMEELGSLDNWAFNIMWEINDQYQGDFEKSKKWANWFAGYVHRNFDDNRLVFTGEQNGAEWATDASNIDGSQHEGYSNMQTTLGSISNGKPKMIVGYDPWNCDGEVEDHLCFGDGSGCIDAKAHIDFFRKSILTGHGVHPGTPFHFKNCGGGKEEILDYIKVLQDFLETVDSWHNEPGDEITNSTLPTYDNYRNFNVQDNDRPDGDGKKGWPRY